MDLFNYIWCRFHVISLPIPFREMAELYRKSIEQCISIVENFNTHLGI